ncbi:MAG: tetratricopeptide repeat protein, partial [Terriglobales bacterium]
TLGPNHPDLAVDLNNLAMLYTSRGWYEQAEPLYQRSMAITEKTLGPDHPALATTLENYAHLLGKTKRKPEAKAMRARAKAIRVRRPP